MSEVLNIAKRKPGEMPTAEEWNRLVGVIEKMLQGSSPYSMVESGRVVGRRVPVKKFKCRSAKIISRDGDEENELVCKLWKWSVYNEEWEEGEDVSVYCDDFFDGPGDVSNHTIPEMCVGDTISVFRDNDKKWYPTFRIVQVDLQTMKLCSGNEIRVYCHQTTGSVPNWGQRG